jgi:DNA polymerase III delta prime subunit
MLDSYFTKLRDTKEVSFPFLIIEGQSHIGKMSLIDWYIRDLTGFFYNSDVVTLQDLSEHLNKDHVFKVEIEEKDQMVDIDWVGSFLEMWARQLNRWLQLAPAGDYKVLVIENIERMNGASANAFLKSLEEPLPRRMIIATTSNLERVLPTIQSRALLFRTQTPSKTVSLTYLEKQFPNVATTTFESLLEYHQGAIGSVITALQIWSFEYLETYQSLCRVWWGSRARERYSLLQELYKRPWGEKILDVLIARKETSIGDRKSLLQAKKLLSSNISDENVVFGLGYGAIYSKV